MSSQLFVFQCGLLVHIAVCLIHDASSACIPSDLQTISIEAPTIQHGIEKVSDATFKIDGCTCINTSRSNCTSLKEAIFNVHSQLQSDQDSPYNFFTLRDLYYSGLLDHRGVYSLEPPPK